MTQQTPSRSDSSERRYISKPHKTQPNKVARRQQYGLSLFQPDLHTLVELPHPEIGVYTHAGVPWTMSGTSCKVRRAAPRLGEDTDYVLGEILGYAPEKIAELRATQVIC